MQIGIDIDGVLNDFEKYQLENGSKYFYVNHKKKIINYNKLDSVNIFSKILNPKIVKQDINFWKKYILDFATNEPARRYSEEVIKKLNEKHMIYIITARCSNLSYSDITPEEMKKIVVKWLEKNNILYDEIIFTNKSKAKVCKDNKIDIMIDDQIKHLKELNKFMKTICYHSNYNDDYENKNCYRAYTWYDILRIINELSKE